MASCNNCYSNIVYIRLSRRLNELIMGTAMSGTSVDQRANIELCYIMTKDNDIAHCVHYGKYCTEKPFKSTWIHFRKFDRYSCLHIFQNSLRFLWQHFLISNSCSEELTLVASNSLSLSSTKSGITLLECNSKKSVGDRVTM